jgi:hypothetical protein
LWHSNRAQNNKGRTILRFTAARARRLPRVGIAVALAVVASAAFLATPRALMLVLLVAWHALLIALPIAAFVLAGLRAGVRDVTRLALGGLAGGGIAAFALFWMWWASPTGGALASITCIAVSAAACAWMAARIERAAWADAAPLGVAALTWLAYALFVLAFGLAPSGFQSPLNAVQQHFGLALPYDNELPFIFAQQVASDRVAVPMSLTWLSSDRPPLQTAYFLASLATLLPRPEVHYQVQATLLQALWAPGLWLLLRSFGVARAALFAALAVGMFSGFAFIHGIFTWPKLFPVAYIAVVAAIVLNAPRETLAEGRVGVATGVCLALAMLCHPGSLFVLIGLAVALVALRRIPPPRFIVVAALTAFIVMLPWVLYQKFVDPPGNRLMKWHLADVQDVDARSVGEAVRDAYAAITFEDLVDDKVEDLKNIVGPSSAIELVAKGSTVGLSDEDAWKLRTLQFFHIAVALGVLALAPLAWLVPRAWRTREFSASLWLTTVCLVTMVPWVLVMLPRGGTVIHTGSLAVVCFLFAAAMLAFYAASRWLALAALVLHTLLTLDVYVRSVPLAEGATAADYRAFIALAVVAFATTCVALWKLCAAESAPRG